MNKILTCTFIFELFSKQLGILKLIVFLTNNNSLGRMDQCCSTLKVRGEGPVTEYVDPTMQPFIFQYSGTTSGKPRYTMEAGGQKCDILYQKEKYIDRYERYQMPSDFDLNSVSYRYGKENERNFWRVSSCIRNCLIHG